MDIIHAARKVLFALMMMSLSVGLQSPSIMAEPIRFGDNFLDTIGCEQTKTFTFEANPKDRIVINVTECSDFGGVCNGACFCFDQCIELRDEADNFIARNCSPRGNNTQNRFRTWVGEELLRTGGLYTVHVADGNSNGRGLYSIFVQRTNNPGRAEGLNSGDTLLGTLNACGEVDTYTFKASAGDRAVIDMLPENGSIDPQLELYDRTGRAVDIPEGGHISRKLTRSGTYTLLAHSKVDTTGTYRISLSIRPSPVSVSVRGLKVNKVNCRNRTTDQQVVIQDGSPREDCEEAGLVIDEDDKVTITVSGKAR